MTVESSQRLLLPSLDELQLVLGNLMDVVVQADRYRKGAPLPPFFLAGIYHDQDDLLRAVIRVDFAFALYCGARLSKIPQGMIDEAAAAGELTDVMRENVHEILNICGLLFNEQRPGAPRVRLTSLVSELELGPDVAQLLVDPKVQGIDTTVSWRGLAQPGTLSVRLLSRSPANLS